MTFLDKSINLFIYYYGDYNKFFDIFLISCENDIYECESCIGYDHRDQIVFNYNNCDLLVDKFKLSKVVNHDYDYDNDEDLDIDKINFVEDGKIELLIFNNDVYRNLCFIESKNGYWVKKHLICYIKFEKIYAYKNTINNFPEMEELVRKYFFVLLKYFNGIDLNRIKNVNVFFDYFLKLKETNDVFE